MRTHPGGRCGADERKMTASIRAPIKSALRLPMPMAQRDSVLHDLLTEIAGVLLPRGITPKRFSELTRFAFVRAAAEMSRLRNGRVNQSRVAAQTGLTRVEVKRLLAQGSPLTTGSHAQAPVERVIRGWQTDRMFADRRGRPRRLRISGSVASFRNLVRKYGGDVPHRAMLEELRRLGAVADRGESVWLNPSWSHRRRRNLAFLAPVLPALIDGIRIASQSSNRLSPSIYR